MRDVHKKENTGTAEHLGVFQRCTLSTENGSCQRQPGPRVRQGLWPQRARTLWCPEQIRISNTAMAVSTRQEEWNSTMGSLPLEGLTSRARTLSTRPAHRQLAGCEHSQSQTFWHTASFADIDHLCGANLPCQHQLKVPRVEFFLVTHLSDYCCHGLHRRVRHGSRRRTNGHAPNALPLPLTVRSHRSSFESAMNSWSCA